MKVLFNGLIANGNFSGVQYYAHRLMQEALRDPEAESFRAVVGRGYPQRFHPAENPDRLLPLPLNPSHRLRRIAFEQRRLPTLYRNLSAEALHCPAYVLPRGFKGRCVVTVHDLIALEHPESCKTANAFYFNLFLPYSIRRADRIIVPSQSVRKEIEKRFGGSGSKISVIPLGIGEDFRPTDNRERLSAVKRKYGLPEKYLLFVGNLEPKKNLARLVEAYGLLIRARDRGHALVIAGQTGWKCGDVLRTVERWGLKDRVCFPGYVADGDLPAVYAGAEVFVFPSLYEGFGLPPLEAMACGVPVVASDIGALREVTGGHALYADPRSAEALARGLYRMLNDEALRRKCITNGLAWADRFSWKDTWERTKAVYRSLREEAGR